MVRELFLLPTHDEKREIFLSLTSYQEGSMTFGNGKKVDIISIGKVGKSHSHAIENIFYVKGLKYNLWNM